MNEDKLSLKTDISQLKDETKAELKAAIDKLRDQVHVATSKVISNNDNIYEKYD